MENPWERFFFWKKPETPRLEKEDSDGCGLSDAAFWILYCVRERREPYTQKEICQIWSYSRQTINSALKNLEQQNLIELIPTPENRRNKQIQLTEKGEALAEEIVKPLMRGERKAFRRLGKQEAEEFLKLVRRYGELLKEEIDKISRESDKGGIL